MGRRRRWFSNERNKRLTIVGGVISAIGTVVAAVVGMVELFTDDGSPQGDGGSPQVVIVQGAGSPGSQTGVAPTIPASGTYGLYGTITDETGTLSVEVPKAWGNLRRNGWFTDVPGYQGRIGPGLNAAPNVGAWSGDLTTPGVFLGVSETIVPDYDPESFARLLEYEGCTFEDDSPFEARGFAGQSVTWQCAVTGTKWFHLAAWPADHAYLVFVQVKLVHPRDEGALDRVLSSFRVSGFP